jgi:O-antigen biosynthesis protein
MNVLQRKFKRAWEIYRENGWHGVWQHSRMQIYYFREIRNYRRWISQNKLEQAKLPAQIAEFAHKPLISIILPVYNVEEKWLRLCIESVLQQIYENWELCIADDKSPSPHIREILNEYAAKDERIKVIFREENGHISAASNTALSLANGEFCVLLDHDDELSADAFFYVVKELNDFPETAMIYSDEDMLDEKGTRYEPKFKPDWSPDLFYSLNLITHLSAYSTEILRKIGGFRIGLEGSQDYDLALRVIEEIDEKQIRHIPKILYHWRAIPGSVAFDSGEKSYAHERARIAIREHFARTKTNAKVENGWQTLHRVIYDLPENVRYEVIQTQNTTAENLNILTEKSVADVLIFVDENVQSIGDKALIELTRFAWQEKIGAVGGKLFDSKGEVCNSGILLGTKNIVGFAHQGFPKIHSGSFIRNQVVQNFSAVSGVLAVRRELFEKLGGFDAGNFQNGLFDIDFCLRLREQNYRIVFTPYAEFLQTGKTATEKVLSSNSAEFMNFNRKWQKIIEKDIYFNPNLSGERFEIRR